MANFDDFENVSDNENEDNGTYFKTGALRDSTIFLVDCTKDMFKNYDDELTYFQKCIKAIQNIFQHKIYGSDKDLLSVIFYGTEKQNNENDFAHVYILQELDQPSAERIKQLESFINDFKYEKFKTNYGHGDKYSLEDVLWCCSNMFSTVKQKLDTKRIMLFTRNDNPHVNDKTLQRLAKNRAKDLYDVSIALELVPVLSDGETFDYSKFYADMLMLSEEQVNSLPDPVEEFKELEKTIRSKDHKKRPYLHMKFSLNNDLALSCCIYNLIRPCPKPAKVKLDKATNIETKTVTKRYIEETGEILFASDLKLAIDVTKEKRVTFEQEEVKSLKKFDTPGMHLLGFKPMSMLKPYYYVKPGHFMYPDETHIEGSITLFRALLEKCLEKNKFILCEIIARVNTPPRLAALCPQAEELDEYKIQITPPGFHVMFLPYADDFREIDKTVTARASEEQIDVFKNCIKKLKMSYNPEDFKNPVIQKMWNEIEAIALEKEKPDEIFDLTQPDVERIESRIGNYLDEYTKLCFPSGKPDFSGKGKRKAPAASKADHDTPKKTKTNEGVDVLNEAKFGRLNKLTVPILKEFVKIKNIKCNGTKKQDLIDAIEAFVN